MHTDAARRRFPNHDRKVALLRILEKDEGLVASQLVWLKQVNGPPIDHVISWVERHIVAVPALGMLATVGKRKGTPRGCHVVHPLLAHAGDNPSPCYLEGFRRIAIPGAIELEANADIGRHLQRAQSNPKAAIWSSSWPSATARS